MVDFSVFYGYLFLIFWSLFSMLSVCLFTLCKAWRYVFVFSFYTIHYFSILVYRYQEKSHRATIRGVPSFDPLLDAYG